MSGDKNLYLVTMSDRSAHHVATDEYHGDYHEETFKEHLLDVIKNAVSGIISGVVVGFVHKGRGPVPPQQPPANR